MACIQARSSKRRGESPRLRRKQTGLNRGPHQGSFSPVLKKWAKHAQNREIDVFSQCAIAHSSEPTLPRVPSDRGLYAESYSHRWRASSGCPRNTMS